MDYHAELAEAGSLALAGIALVTDHWKGIACALAVCQSITTIAAFPHDIQALRFSLTLIVSTFTTLIEDSTNFLSTVVTAVLLLIDDALAAVWALVPPVGAVDYSWPGVVRMVIAFLLFFRWAEGGVLNRTLSGILYLGFLQVFIDIVSTLIAPGHPIALFLAFKLATTTVLRFAANRPWTVALGALSMVLLWYTLMWRVAGQSCADHSLAPRLWEVIPAAIWPAHQQIEWRPVPGQWPTGTILRGSQKLHTMDSLPTNIPATLLGRAVPGSRVMSLPVMRGTVFEPILKRLTSGFGTPPPTSSSRPPDSCAHHVRMVPCFPPTRAQDRALRLHLAASPCKLPRVIPAFAPVTMLSPLSPWRRSGIRPPRSGATGGVWRYVPLHQARKPMGPIRAARSRRAKAEWRGNGRVRKLEVRGARIMSSQTYNDRPRQPTGTHVQRDKVNAPTRGLRFSPIDQTFFEDKIKEPKDAVRGSVSHANVPSEKTEQKTPPITFFPDLRRYKGQACPAVQDEILKSPASPAGEVSPKTQEDKGRVRPRTPFYSLLPGQPGTSSASDSAYKRPLGLAGVEQTDDGSRKKRKIDEPATKMPEVTDEATELETPNIRDGATDTLTTDPNPGETASTMPNPNGGPTACPTPKSNDGATAPKVTMPTGTATALNTPDPRAEAIVPEPSVREATILEATDLEELEDELVTAFDAMKTWQGGKVIPGLSEVRSTTMTLFDVVHRAAKLLRDCTECGDIRRLDVEFMDDQRNRLQYQRIQLNGVVGERFAGDEEWLGRKAAALVDMESVWYALLRLEDVHEKRLGVLGAYEGHALPTW